MSRLKRLQQELEEAQAAAATLRRKATRLRELMDGMPALPEGQEAAGHVTMDPDMEAIPVGPDVMRALYLAAVDLPLKHQRTVDDLRDPRRQAPSFFVGGYRVTPGEYCRCLFDTPVDREKRELVWVDVNERTLGIVVEQALEERDRQAARMERRVAPRSVHAPRWAGSFSFERMYADIGRYADEEESTPFRYLAREAHLLLNEAHPLLMAPSQVDVLPDWESMEDAWDFATDADPPFPVTLLDFETVGRIRPCIVVEGTKRALNLQLAGALVFDSWEGGLEVMPIGQIDWRGRWGSAEYVPLGRLSVGGELQLEKVAPLVEGEDGVTVAPWALKREAWLEPSEVSPDEQNLPGRMLIPFDQDDLANSEACSAWGYAVWLACAKALAALAILDADAVVVEEAQLEKRDRKRAETRRWPIASTVRIGPVRKRDGDRPAPSGEKAHYSHRFWVRGHTKHFSIGTRLATARPDLVRPCTRVGDASCGLCRRVWTPPFIKGPEDKPIVLKTLVRTRPKPVPIPQSQRSV